MPRPQRRLSRSVDLAEAAAELDRHVDRGANAGNRLDVDRPAGEGAVEIDDVQPLRAGRRPAPRGFSGIVVEDGLASEIALDQTDAAAAADVDCRVEDHAETLSSACAPAVAGTLSTQPATIRSPPGPLFSG